MATIDKNGLAGRSASQFKPAQLKLQEAFVANLSPQIAEDTRRYGGLGGEVDHLQGEGPLALGEFVFQYQRSRPPASLTDPVKNTVHQGSPKNA